MSGPTYILNKYDLLFGCIWRTCELSLFLLGAESLAAGLQLGPMKMEQSLHGGIIADLLSWGQSGWDLPNSHSMVTAFPSFPCC